MHPNRQVIEDFYSAFERGDHAAMAEAYSDDATFTDPAFGTLNAEQARAMWRMFCTGGNDITITYGNVHADEGRGSAHWEAVYPFPKTKRTVHNRIDAHFEFSGGKISKHVDSFDLWRWSRMALGPLGTALGWSPIVKKQIRSQARTQLERFMRNEA